jgi:hypothetical protein
MVVDFGPLAAKTGPGPGCDVCGETFPYIPGGDEVAGCPPARASGSVEVFKTCRRRSLGTSGWKIPLDESPMR